MLPSNDYNVSTFQGKRVEHYGDAATQVYVLTDIVVQCVA